MTSLRDLQLEKLRRIFSAFKSMGVYQVIGIIVTIALGLGIYAFKSDTFSSTCDSTKMSSDSKNPENYKEAKSIYEFSAKDIHGEDVSLEKYKGHVCIIVNVASQCGFTKNNYAELSELYQQYGESQGLRILAFPCNQFGNQEPGTNAEICEFVKTKNVDFDMFEKVNVNGDNSHPLWNYLKYKQGGILGNFIKWNFTKFIIDKNGQPVERHGPSTNPKDLVKALQKYW